jgi:amino-acid N-acetyltransferase
VVVCPFGLGPVRRLLGPIADPATDDPAIGREEMLDRFRRARGEILTRLVGLAAAMPPDGVALVPAEAADAGGIRALVAGCELPVEGLADQFPRAFVVARRGDALVGCAALEVHGDAGVLRSVAVAAAERGSGLGVALTAERIEAARARRLAAVYLLTTTAAGFYARFGFEPFPRAGVPDAVARSPEFASVCPSSATCLALSI